ncbi:CAP domain-containing protein [Nocardioides caeni]|uniref:CAP domain-containing protein n=1 Tax=Nocardioides caeni TaxID=574700 RepID=A0A4S8N2U3_9ACTN|nr:CAP domain-containing protein [Nocardioides caeni]THV10085.1 CAP domain-containing protein [Nocardioides caeni]
MLALLLLAALVPGHHGAAAAQAATVDTRPARTVPLPDRFESAIHDRINIARAKRDLPRLAHADGGCLNRYAESYARRMAANNRLAHHLSPSTVFADCGGGRVGEVVAGGFDSAATAVRVWMRSDSHRAVLTRRAYRIAAVGAARSPEGNAFVSVLVWHR